MNDAPLVAGSLYGLRTWRVVADDDGEALVGPLYGAAWPAGGDWLRASCPNHDEVPAAGCDCGVHAWHPSLRAARDVFSVKRMVPGVVEAQGPIEVHEEGFRAQRGRPYALVAVPGRNGCLVRRLADRYGAAVVEAARPEDLLAFCRERRLGLDEQVVGELLGADPNERRRAKLRKARTDALRVAVAVVVSGLLVVLGLTVATDPPGDRTLWGRAGQIHVN